MNKTILRKECLSKRKLLPEKTVNYSDLLPCIESAITIFCYISFGNEINTFPLLKKLLQCGKTLVVPRCIDNAGNMIAVQISSLSCLTKGHFGILEPDSLVPFDKSQIDIAIIPGAAFDKEGYRLGYGKGYYDRFLADTNILKIGICHKELLLPHIPHLPHDIKCDRVISL